MRLAARVLLPGTGWVAFKQLIDLVVLWMDLLGKRVLPRQSLALYDFHTMKAVCEATISFSVRRPAFSNTNFEDTLSLRLVLVMGFVMGIFPLRNGFYLVTAIKVNPIDQ